MTKIDIEQLGPIVLQAGSTMDRPNSMCVMQAVALVTGDTDRRTRLGQLTDRPSCVDPALILLAINVNDSMLSDERQGLKARIPQLIDTRGDGLEEAREWLMADFVVHELVPFWMVRDPKATAEGLLERVAAIPAVTDRASLLAAERALNLIETNLIASEAYDVSVNACAWHGVIRTFSHAVAAAGRSVPGGGWTTMAQAITLSASSKAQRIDLLDRLLALSNTPLHAVEVGDLADAPHDGEVVRRQAAFLESLVDSGYTPFPDPAPNSFMCLEN